MERASTERIMVPFEGEGAGEGDLTWGQRHIWQAMQERNSSLSMSAVRALDTETVDDIVAELQFYLRHHQTMRTRLRFTANGSPRQVVACRGEFPLQLVDADGGDPAGVAEALTREFEALTFDYVHEWPLRAAVVRRRGVPTHLAMTACHLAMDAAGAAVMVGSRDPGTGRPRAPITAPQPLELARREAGPGAQRVHTSAMRHWEGLLRAISPDRFAAPLARPLPRYWEVSYDSPAISLAQRAVAGRTGVGSPAVLLAAFAVALVRVTGIHPVVTQLIASNRFRPGLAEVVAPISQPGLCVLDIADRTFDEAVVMARSRAMQAHKHAYYDRQRLNASIARVGRERGSAIDLACIYNDRRRTTGTAAGPPPDPAAVRAAVPDARLRWERLPGRFNGKLMLHIDETPGVVRLLAQADVHYLPADDLVALLRGVEAAVVEAVG